jgi:Flp pilus assembly protein TadG
MARLKRDALNRRAWRRRRGIEVVEVAIVLPVLMLVIFGIIQYGWLFLKAAQIENAAREGARVAVLPGKANSDATTRVNNALPGIASGKITKHYYVSTDNGTTWTEANVSTATTGQLVKVSVSVLYSDVRVSGGSIVPTPTTLKSAVVMTREGP